MLAITGVVMAAVLGQLKAGVVAGGCTQGTGPDVITGQLSGIAGYGTVGGVSGYALGTTSCNIGSQALQWDADTSNHPVIAQNLYRLRNGRFEQIGQSWLKHGFSALTLNLCCTCQNPGNNQLLGVGCSDPYGSFLNGDQDGAPGCGGVCGGLGPRYQVNATTGVFAYPYAAMGLAGDAIYKRLQVHVADLDPALNAGAKYYGEGQYIAADDAAAANHHNNASYAQALVTNFTMGAWGMVFTGPTTRELPALYAWQADDPQVVINVVEDDGGAADAHDGRFRLGCRVTNNGDGTWHYEYALYNMNSHRSARSFTMPVLPGVTIGNLGFHDVEYHSGDGESGVTYDGTDWAAATVSGQVSWSTQAFEQNQNANALRWGTMYNFRFDADAPPVAATATIALFRPGSPAEVSAAALGPRRGGSACPWDCADGDGTVGLADFLAVLAQWGGSGSGCDLGLGAPGVGIEEFLDLLANWGVCS